MKLFFCMSQVSWRDGVLLLQGTLERKAAEAKKIINKKLGVSMHYHDVTPAFFFDRKIHAN